MQHTCLKGSCTAVFSISPFRLELSCLAAAGQLQASGDGKLQAETKMRQAQHELAEQKAVEQRLRDRLARQEAKSQDRKEVGAASVPLCVFVLPYVPCYPCLCRQLQHLVLNAFLLWS